MGVGKNGGVVLATGIEGERDGIEGFAKVSRGGGKRSAKSLITCKRGGEKPKRKRTNPNTSTKRIARKKKFGKTEEWVTTFAERNWSRVVPLKTKKEKHAKQESSPGV